MWSLSLSRYCLVISPLGPSLIMKLLGALIAQLTVPLLGMYMYMLLRVGNFLYMYLPTLVNVFGMSLDLFCGSKTFISCPLNTR